LHKSQKTLIGDTQASGGKVTINHDLKVIRRNLNLAESEWIDDYGMNWLLSAPKIKLLPDTDKQKPYPLNWNDQKDYSRSYRCT
jgi:hypothetical protein